MEELYDERRAYRVAKNRFVIMLVGSIGIALFLVSIALALYASSGTAQLDLSRPGYSGVRSQASADQNLTIFASTGEINKQTVDKFEELYDKTANQVTSSSPFESGALNDEALRINSNPAATSNQ